MRKQLIVSLLIAITLVVALAWRVRAQDAYKRKPSGGSATLEGTDAVVASKQGGRLLTVRVHQGDAVKKGDLVAELDCTDQDAAVAGIRARKVALEAQVLVAEAAAKTTEASVGVAGSQVSAARAREKASGVELELATGDRSRADALHDSGVASPVDKERADGRTRALEEQLRMAKAGTAGAHAQVAVAQTNVLTSRAQVEAARAQVVAIDADIRRAELAVAECRLYAPRDGVVTARLHEPGAVVGPGTRVVALLDLSTVKAVFFLPNAEVGRVKLDAPAEVRVDTFGAEVFAARVTRIGSEAEFTPRNVQTREDRDRLVFAVEVRLDNQDGRLRAGMPAEVSLPGTGR